MRTKTVAIALCALLAAPQAIAQPRLPGAHFIENWDADGDGSVTREEASGKRDELFTMFDQDGDDTLNEAEYTLFDDTRRADMAENAGGRARGLMAVIDEGMSRAYNDADGDGMVTRAEFAAKSDAWFATVDKTGDGVVTSADFTAAGG